MGQVTPLDDGNYVVSTAVRDDGTKTNVGGASQYPDVGDQLISIRGMIPPAGGVRDYQCWYRNAADFCTPATFNLTNAIEITWNP